MYVVRKSLINFSHAGITGQRGIKILQENAMPEEKETIVINQPVDAVAYRRIKAAATLQKKSVTELVNNAIIEYAAKIKL
jgi:TPP-dependent indolepyruvate ferredoxin oxidoreductase alpha subunit